MSWNGDVAEPRRAPGGLVWLAVIALLAGGVFVGVRAMTRSQPVSITGPLDSQAATTAGDATVAGQEPAGPAEGAGFAASDSLAPTPTVPVSATSAPGRFATIPPGGDLPSDSDCAARVRRGEPEIRPANAKFNSTPGAPTAADADPNYPRYARVTGNFTGTTDEIIQWAACKWGIDEDVVRAQAAKETYWFQKNLGDFNSDPTRCVPGHAVGADGQPGKCPESIGIMQVRAPYFVKTIDHAITSTAYNLDLAYAVWRTCYEGEEPWLNKMEKGQDYEAGDLWGCVGRWYAGRWYTARALEYIAAVKGYVDQRIWQTQGFLDYSG